MINSNHNKLITEASNGMKKRFLHYRTFLIPLSFFLSFAQVAFAADPSLGYVPLAPLPGVNAGNGGAVNLGAYLQSIFKFGVGICALLAVLMIVIGGLEYIMTENVASKEDAKGRITSALGGLLLALISVTLLYTINPALIGTKSPSISSVPATAPNASVVDVPQSTYGTEGNQPSDSTLPPGYQWKFKADDIQDGTGTGKGYWVAQPY